MSTVALGLNIFLAVMLTLALVLGWRLNRRLKALRDSHDSFAKAVQELNWAAQRAEQGLADLRAATDEANEALADRIEKARELVGRLDSLAEEPVLLAHETNARERAFREALEEPPARAPISRTREPELRLTETVRREGKGERLGALLAAARGSSPRSPRSSVEDLVRNAPPPPARSRTPRVDDDLFDEPLELGPLSAVRGARR